MSPNGRRAWREWMRKANPRRKLRPPTHSICRLAREGRRHIGPIPPETPKPFTPRSLVGMTQGARKRRARKVASDRGLKPYMLHEEYRIGETLRPCPGCPECDHGKCWKCDHCGTTKGLCDLILSEVRCKCGQGCGQWRISFPAKTVCDGSGVLLATRQLCLGCSWCGTPPKETATRFTVCDGSGVLPARRA